MNKNDKKISYLEERINKLQDNLTLLKIIIGVIVVLVILNFIVKNPEVQTIIQYTLYLGFGIGWPVIGTILCYNVAKEKYQEKSYADVIAMFFIWLLAGGGAFVILVVYGFFFW